MQHIDNSNKFFRSNGFRGFSTAALFLLLAAPAVAHPGRHAEPQTPQGGIVRIEIGPADSFEEEETSQFKGELRQHVLAERRENRRLRKRLRRLERAVRQLQEELFDSRGHSGVYHRPVIVPAPVAPTVEFACMLETSLSGTFVARAASKVEATAAVLQRCNNAMAPFCERKEVVCERSLAH